MQLEFFLNFVERYQVTLFRKFSQPLAKFHKISGFSDSQVFFYLFNNKVNQQYVFVHQVA